MIKPKIYNKGTRYQVERTACHFVIEAVVCRLFGHSWAEYIGNKVMGVSRCGRCNKWSLNMKTMKEHNGIFPPIIAKTIYLYKTLCSLYEQKFTKDDDLPF